MVRIVISIVLLIALCVLVVLNLEYRTSINLFWVRFDQVSVVAIALVSFVFGVLYSFFLYATRYFVGLRRNSLLARSQDLAQREQEAVAREKEAARQRTPGPDADNETQAAQSAAAPRKRRRLSRR